MSDTPPNNLSPAANNAIVELLEVQRKTIETSAELSVLLRQVQGSGSLSTRKRQALRARMTELIVALEHAADEIKRLTKRYHDWARRHDSQAPGGIAAGQ